MAKQKNKKKWIKFVWRLKLASWEDKKCMYTMKGQIVYTDQSGVALWLLLFSDRLECGQNKTWIKSPEWIGKSKDCDCVSLVCETSFSCTSINVLFNVFLWKKVGGCHGYFQIIHNNFSLYKYYLAKFSVWTIDELLCVYLCLCTFMLPDTIVTASPHWTCFIS